MWDAFALQYFLLKKCEMLLQCKSVSHFFNKKYWYIWDNNIWNFDTLTNDVVSFEQPGPGCDLDLRQWNQKFVCDLHVFSHCVLPDAKPGSICTRSFFAITEAWFNIWPTGCGLALGCGNLKFCIEHTFALCLCQAILYHWKGSGRLHSQFKGSVHALHSTTKGC